MSGTREQAIKNLSNVKHRGRRRPKHLTFREIDFLSHYILTGRIKRSALGAGFHFNGHVYELLKRPAAIDFIEYARALYAPQPSHHIEQPPRRQPLEDTV